MAVECIKFANEASSAPKRVDMSSQLERSAQDPFEATSVASAYSCGRSSTTATPSVPSSSINQEEKELLAQSNLRSSSNSGSTSVPSSPQPKPCIPESTKEIPTLTVVEALSSSSTTLPEAIPQSTPCTPKVVQQKDSTELKPPYPTTPPTTPSISAASVKTAQQNEDFLSPDCPKLVFGCTDDSITRSKKLITVCMHGDEVCGMIAVNELIKQDFFSQFFKGELKYNRLTIVLGNPKGVKANKRFIDVNLNRIFHVNRIKHRTKQDHSSDRSDKEEYIDDLKLTHYELSRVQPIADEIADCDEYVDIHSTSAQSYPFALPSLDEDSEQFARTFDVHYVIEKLIKSVEGTTIGWANLLKKRALCVECGQHEARETVEVAKRVIQRFVSGVVGETAKYVLTCTENEKIRKGFHYKTPPVAFEEVKYNQVIAEDDELGEIKCQNSKGAYIIMPTANPILGEEAWFWGELKYKAPNLSLPTPAKVTPNQHIS